MSEILLIDAEEPFAGDMKSALEGRGFRVQKFDDGKAGLEHAKDSVPSLIVLCAELPKQSGYSICNKLKKDNALKDIPLIITSSEATPETFAQHRKLKTRAEDYLIKPFDPPALLEKIGALIALPAGGGNGAASAAVPAAPRGEENLDFADLSEADSLLDGLEDSSLGGAGLGDAGAEDADSLLDALDGGGGLDAGGDLGDLDLDASLDSLEGGAMDAGLEAGLDDALSGLEGEPEPEPPPRPASRPPEPAISAAYEGTPSTLPSSAADLAALNAARRENTDLKARVVELEARLKLAEEQAAEAKADLESSKSSGSASARETLDLKKTIREREKELMGLKDEIFQKEEAIVEVQEQLESTKADLHRVQDAASTKDTELASMRARVDALTQERDDLANQVGERLAAAEQEVQDLQGRLQATEGRLQSTEGKLHSTENELSTMKGKLYDAEQKIAGLEADLGGKSGQLEDTKRQLDDARKRLKSEENLRQKAKEALEIGLTLLSGDDGGLDGLQADA